MDLNLFSPRFKICDQTKEVKDAQSDAQKEMLMHLHEQFAINHNENLGALITLFIAMLGVLGAYGAVLLDTDSFNASRISYECRILIVTLFADLILTILIYINAYQGYHVRKDQFITYRIRDYYNLEQLENADNKCVVNYSPFNKKGLDIFTGLYGKFIEILIAVYLFINGVSIFRVWWRTSDNNFKIFLSIVLIFSLICLCTFSYIINHYIREYHKIEKYNNRLKFNIKCTK